MARIYFLIVIITVITGCSIGNGDNPEKIIPEDLFISVLVDIHIADAGLNVVNLKKKYSNFNADDYYEHVLKRHNVSREQFNETIKYYTYNLNKFDKIYDQVITELSKADANLRKTDTTHQNQPPAPK